MKLNETQKSIVRSLFLKRQLARKTLARSLKLSNPGLTLAVKPLVKEGIIAFATKIVTGKAGRNEEPLCLNQNYGLFAGIDAGVSSYHFVLLSLAGFTVFEADYTSVKEVMEKLHYYITNSKVVNLCVTFRHYGCHKPFTPMEKELYDALANFNEVPVVFKNSIMALAEIHHLYKNDNRTIFLVKYGPELTAAILEDGKRVRNEKDMCSQIGLTYISEGVTAGVVVDYASILGKEYEEDEGAMMLINDDEKLNRVLDVLALVIYNSDRLFVFDSIVFAGSFLSSPGVFNKLIEKMKALGDKFDADKVSLFEEYATIYSQKSALAAFISHFSDKK